MNNAKKLLYIILFLFITVIYQIGAIIRLNRLDRQLSQKVSAANISAINKNTDNNEINNEPDNVQADKNNNEETTHTDNTETNSSYLISTQNDYSDIDIITSDENLQKIFGNSMFIGDSRTDAIRKFTQVGNYADFCCDVGINITKLVTNTFFVQNENITIYDAVSKYAYDKIFISIGYNELGWTYEDTFIEKYSALIDEIRRLSPDTEIYILSIIHISDDAAVANERENNARIDLYNNKIAELCTQKSVQYIDLNPDFLNADGNLISESSTDGIHFNSEYCRKYVYKLINSLN